MTSRGPAIARGVVLQTAARGAALPLSLLTLALATRYLGPQGYGVLTTAIVLTGLFETFTELGIGRVIVRRVAGEGASLDRLVGLSVALSMTYALPLGGLAALTGLVVYRGQPDVQLACAVVASGLVWRALSSCYDPLFDVHVEYRAVAIADVGARLFGLAAVAGVVWGHAGLGWMSAAITVPHFVRLVLVAFGARRLGRMRPRFHVAEAWDLLRESMPLTLLIVVAVLYWNADGFLLTLLAPVEQVAAYGVSLQIAFALTVVGQVFGRATLSTINAAFRQDPPRFRAAVDRAYRFLLLCAAPVAVLGWPLAPRIVDVVAGPAFTPVAGPVLRVFFIAVALMFLTAVSTDVLIAAEEQRFLWRLSTANLGGNVALNLALIPVLGAVGAGISLITSELSGVVFAHRRIRRHGAPAFPVDQLLRLAPGLALALLGMWLTWSLPLAAALTAGTVGYVAGALAGRAVPRDMIDALLAAFRRVPRTSGVGR